MSVFNQRDTKKYQRCKEIGRKAFFQEARVTEVSCHSRFKVLKKRRKAIKPSAKSTLTTKHKSTRNSLAKKRQKIDFSNMIITNEYRDTLGGTYSC